MKYSLQIEGPTATCGECRFMSALSGTFSVEGGRLVWRGDRDLQPRRGPDLEGCCEREAIDFDYIEVDGKRMAPEYVAELRATARKAESEWSYENIPYWGDEDVVPLSEV